MGRGGGGEQKKQRNKKRYRNRSVSEIEPGSGVKCNNPTTAILPFVLDFIEIMTYLNTFYCLFQNDWRGTRGNVSLGIPVSYLSTRRAQAS